MKIKLKTNWVNKNIGHLFDDQLFDRSIDIVIAYWIIPKKEDRNDL